MKTVEGDMANLCCFEDASLDFVFHPCSNTFVPDMRPVWQEAHRVLRAGGDLVSGICNPIISIFDDLLREQGKLELGASQDSLLRPNELVRRGICPLPGEP